MSISEDSWKNIFDYVGTGSYLFVSPVSTSFHKEYTITKGKETSSGNVLLSLTRLHSSIESGYSPSYKDYNILASQFDSQNCAIVAEDIFERGIKLDRNSMMFASEYGNKRYISWAISRNIHCTMDTLFLHLSRFGQLEIMKWIHRGGNTPNRNSLMVAANYNQKSVIDWVLSIEVVNGEFICVLAENGYIDTLKWAIEEKGFSSSEFLLNCAAAGGSLEIVKYLIKCHGIKVTKETVYSACSSGSKKMNNFIKTRYQDEYTKNMLDVLERYSL